MEVDLQSLFKLHVTCCAQLYSLAPQLRPSPRIWTCITRALLVSKERRHLFVTPCTIAKLTKLIFPSPVILPSLTMSAYRPISFLINLSYPFFPPRSYISSSHPIVLTFPTPIMHFNIFFTTPSYFLPLSTSSRIPYRHF